MRFLILGDLHGQESKFYFKDFDAIITPGDFCPLDNIRKLMFEVITRKQKNKDSKFKWYELCGKREARKLIKDSISKGRKVLENLNSFEVPVFIVPGNADWTKDKTSEWDFLKEDHFNFLIKGLKNIINVHYKVKEFGNFQIIGYGISTGPEYPQHKEQIEKFKLKQLKKIKRQYEREKRKTDKLFQKARQNKKPIILLSHNVPFNTSLDKITYKKSPMYGYHYGSLVVREMIEKYHPLVSIGGHIHEHFGKCKIGKTVCINAGFGSKRNTLLETDKNKIKRIKFH